jgi:HlyD family secretion protein
MRTLLILAVVLAVLVGAVAAAYRPAITYWEQQNAPKWRMAEVAQGDIVSVVNATGTIKPVSQVSIGSFVSGPISPNFEMKDADGNPILGKDGKPLRIAEFNQEIKQGQVLAKVDPRIYEANLARDKATFESRKHDASRVAALLQQARNDEKRAYALRADDPAFIAQAELDKVRFNRMSLEAQLELANAVADQAKAQLDFTQLQLDYTNIVSPVDGIIINRKIDPGQTLAAQFQTPELFIVAPDMRKKMQVHASVDEADIGLIQAAKQKGLPVTFTVDAYPDDLFSGQIEEIRLSSTTTQNVVTYPVVVEAPNSELKLLPGMTASLSFEVDRRADVLTLPNSALRFFPQPQHVRPEDKPLLEGKADERNDKDVSEVTQSAGDRSSARKNRRRRHVWVVEGHKLRAVEVRTGLSDSQRTELVSGVLKRGDKLVIGIQPAAAAWGK